MAQTSVQQPCNSRSFIAINFTCNETLAAAVVLSMLGPRVNVY